MGEVNETAGLPAAGGAAPSRPAAAQRPRDAKLWKAATDFQEIILSQFTQTMRTTDKDNDLVEQCAGSDTFNQMFSDAIAHEMSKSGALGLNKTIYRAMGGTYVKTPLAPASGTAVPQGSAGRIVPAKPGAPSGGAAGSQVVRGGPRTPIKTAE